MRARWSDFDDTGTITVSHALGNGPGGFCLKESKTGSSARTIPLKLRAKSEKSKHWVSFEAGLAAYLSE